MDEEETGKMTTLFEHVTAVTMDREIPVIQDAYVAVEGTKIASVGTEPPEGTFDRVVDGAGKVLLPGFVNAHTLLTSSDPPGSTSISFLPRRAWTAGRWRRGPGWAWRR